MARHVPVLLGVLFAAALAPSASAFDAGGFALQQHQHDLIRQQSGVSGGGEPDAAGPAPRVLDRRMFVAFMGEDGLHSPEETSLVPYIPGTACYGWNLQLEGGPETLEVIETLELPAPSATWEVTDGVSVSADGTTAAAPRTLVQDDGWVGHGWCLVEGNPLGTYTVTVSADDWLFEVFEFEVVLPD